MRIALLGPLTVDGSALNHRESTVLAALSIVRGRSVEAASLADACWREDPPATWSKQVQAVRHDTRTRRIIAVALALVVALPLGGCTGGASAGPASGDASTPSAGAGLTYLAMGDSWPYGAHCGNCETFVGRFQTGLEELSGEPVELFNRTTNGGDSGTVRDVVEADDAVRDEIAKSDVILISTGINDLDSTGALRAVGDGTCGQSNACLEELYEKWRTNFPAILDEIQTLRAGAPTALRLVAAQNIFLSDPTIAVDYGLPEDFAMTTGREIITTLTQITCDAAAAHGGRCIDAGLLFNGPDGTTPYDETTPESMQVVADALIALGIDELSP